MPPMLKMTYHSKRMQFKREEYDREKHDRWFALSVKQPFAQYIANGVKTIEVRSQYINYRGDVMICSSAKPVINGMMSGVSLCLAELYDCRKLSEFTDEQLAATMLPKDQIPKDGYGWMLRNIRRVVEHPVKGQLGLWNLVYTKDCIIPYPTKFRYDKKLKTWVCDVPKP